jgi:hypothetical protein
MCGKEMSPECTLLRHGVKKQELGEGEEVSVAS